VDDIYIVLSAMLGVVFVDFAVVKVWASGRNGSVTVEHTFRCQHWCDMAFRNTKCPGSPQICAAHWYNSSLIRRKLVIAL